MHDIVHELTIASPPEQVYDAVTTPEGIARWWSTDVTGSRAEGDELQVGFEQHAVVMRLRFDTLDPPVLAHLTCVDGPEEWTGTEIAFRVEANGEGTVVRFWHGGWEYEDGALPRCSFRWAMYLDSLRRALETGAGSPA
jgi:uncharacterized protein YndB with AHSA1/START domain